MTGRRTLKLGEARLLCDARVNKPTVCGRFMMCSGVNSLIINIGKRLKKRNSYRNNYLLLSKMPIPPVAGRGKQRTSGECE